MTVHFHCKSCNELELLENNMNCKSCNGNPWRDSSVELPEFDCMVECGNNINDPFDIEVREYNGYGFKIFGMYKHPNFWRYTKLSEKKYGKL